MTGDPAGYVIQNVTRAAGPVASADPTPSVADLLLARVGDDHPGLRFEDRQWTWDEVLDESAARASLLRSIDATGHRSIDHTGHRSVDDHAQVHVGILLPNVPEYIRVLKYHNSLSLSRYRPVNPIWFTYEEAARTVTLSAASTTGWP